MQNTENTSTTFSEINQSYSLADLNPKYTLWVLNQRRAEFEVPIVVFLAVLLLFGTFGNGITIFVYQYFMCRTTAHVFTKFLAILDFAGCVIGIPFEMFPLMYGQSSLIACKVLRELQVYLSFISPLILICIAYDRYHHVCKPLQVFTMKTVHRILAVTSVLPLLYVWPCLIIFGESKIETSVPGIVGSDCSFDQSMGDLLQIFVPVLAVVIILQYIISLPILIVLYFRIWWHLRRRSKIQIGETIAKKNAVNTRITVVFAIITFTFAITYAPVPIAFMIAFFNPTPNTDYARLMMYGIMEKFYFVNNAINPLLYAFFYPRFRSGVCMMFKGKDYKKSQATSSTRMRVDNVDHMTS